MIAMHCSGSALSPLVGESCREGMLAGTANRSAILSSSKGARRLTLSFNSAPRGHPIKGEGEVLRITALQYGPAAR